MVRKKKGVADGNETSREYNHWEPNHDKPFVECLLELVDQGKIEDGQCKNGVYKELKRMMETRVPGCGIKAKPTITTRIRKLKHWFHATMTMKKESGWGWHTVDNHVIVPNDVWEVYVKTHPTFKNYRDTPFPEFWDLVYVFGTGRATGEMGFQGADGNLVVSSDDDVEPTVPLSQMNTPVVDEEMFNIINKGVETATTKASGKRKVPTSAPTRKKKKLKTDDLIDEAASDMVGMRPLIRESVDTIARAMGESEMHIEMKANLMDALGQMAGLTRAQMVLASRRLCKDPRDLKCFYDMEDEEDRLTLVLDVLEK
ncbi:unnamed protein product [Linum trigynum]|uniref:Myb/SANT-like domain-containing protein n=1 Tax=Linum trigynum TaxID=586398 RepID=A0AAV2GNB1_9ROSI